MSHAIRVPLQVCFLALVTFLLALPAAAVTLTITITGTNTGNVSARPVSGNGGGLCFGAMPHPTPPCNIDFPAGTVVRIMANSPNTPGIIQPGGTGEARAKSAPITTGVRTGR